MPFKSKFIRRKISSCKDFVLLEKYKYKLRTSVYSLNLFTLDSSIINLHSTLSFYFNDIISDLVMNPKISTSDILNSSKILFIDCNFLVFWLQYSQCTYFSSFQVVLVIQSIDCLPSLVFFRINFLPEPAWIPRSIA